MIIIIIINYSVFIIIYYLLNYLYLFHDYQHLQAHFMCVHSFSRCAYDVWRAFADSLDWLSGLLILGRMQVAVWLDFLKCLHSDAGVRLATASWSQSENIRWNY
mgnify:CR=1 FL=1